MNDLQSNAKVLVVEGVVSNLLAYMITLPPFFRMISFLGFIIWGVVIGWFLRGWL